MSARSAVTCDQDAHEEQGEEANKSDQLQSSTPKDGNAIPADSITRVLVVIPTIS
jgi:hypothetical protein